MEANQSSAVDRVLAPLYRVSRRSGLDPLADRLAAIRTWLSDDLVELERAIRLGSMSEELGATDPAAWSDMSVQASRYLLERPGKRIRPLCVMLAARLGGRSLDRQVKDLAVACELVHTATLLHDDVIDVGTERRGAPSARVVFGNAASVLAGDHLLLHSLKLVAQVGYRRLLDQLLDTIADMVTAEAMQLDMRGRFDPNREKYLEIVQGKTAGLFRWALIAGGTASGLASDHIAALGNVGNALGLAFQLMDDVLDLSGDPNLCGKDLLVDLREGKLTWPFIVAAERDERVLGAVAEFVQQHDAGGEAPDVRPVFELLLATGALDATREFALAQGEAAKEALAMLPDGPATRALDVVVDAAIQRSR